MNSLSAESEKWSGRSLRSLIEHILERFHAVHREQLPQMIVEVAMKIIGADDASLMLPDDHKPL